MLLSGMSGIPSFQHRSVIRDVCQLASERLGLFGYTFLVRYALKI